jgi:hypothetical protein
MPSRGRLGYGGRKTRPPLRSARELERWTSAEPQSLAGTGLAPGARAAGAAVANWNTRAVEGTGCPPELVRFEGGGARVRAQRQQACVLARSSNGASGGTYPRRADEGDLACTKCLRAACTRTAGSTSGSRRAVGDLGEPKRVPGLDVEAQWARCASEVRRRGHEMPPGLYSR